MATEGSDFGPCCVIVGDATGIVPKPDPQRWVERSKLRQVGWQCRYGGLIVGVHPRKHRGTTCVHDSRCVPVWVEEADGQTT